MTVVRAYNQGRPSVGFAGCTALIGRRPIEQCVFVEHTSLGPRQPAEQPVRAVQLKLRQIS